MLPKLAGIECIENRTTHRLPAVLRVEEVKRLLTSATPVHHQVSCTTVSRLGLRLHAARSLQVSDLEGQRLQVYVHRGQGAKDHYVP
jgi:integrase